MADPYTYAGPRWTELAWRDPAGMRRRDRSTVSDAMAERSRAPASTIDRGFSVPAPRSMAGTTPESTTGAMLPKTPTGNGLMVPRTPGGPAPVTMDREGNPVAGVSGRLHALTDSESPYIQRRRAKARQYANRRGLMASSIAAGAGEAAAIDAALPIAQADASIAAGERAMRSQEFQQYRSIRSQELMQQKGLDHEAAQREADRELSEIMQARNHRVQQLMQREGLDHDAAQQLANRELKSVMQRRGFAFQGEQAALDRSHQRTLATEARDFAGEQAALDRDQQTGTQDRAIEAQERQARDAAIRNINSVYGSQITAISLNTNIPVEERRALEQHFGFLRDQAIEALGEVYGYTPTWDSTRRPEGG